MSNTDNLNVPLFTYNRHSIISTNDVRQTRMSDLKSIEKLVSETTILLFGNVDCKELLDKCALSMSLKVEKEIVATICLHDRPNLPSIPSWEWNHWLYNIYGLETVTSRNTLWIHLMVWDNLYVYAFIPYILKKTFIENTYLEHIIVVIPSKVTTVDFLKANGTRILPKGYSDPSKVQTLFLFVRQHFVTKYKIRRAVEEDNDDLIPLIDSHSERLKQYYGKFYIAELLTRHSDCGRQLIVAEYNQHAVAVLCLNEKLDDHVLNREFELVPFYGLRKPHPCDVFNQADCDSRSSTIPTHITEEELEEGEISRIIFPKATASKESSVYSFDSYELEIGIHKPKSEASEDDFSIVNVSSLQLVLSNDKSDLSRRWSNISTCSAVMLSSTNYETQMVLDKSNMREMSCEEDLDYKCLRRDKDFAPNLPKFYGELNAFTLEIAASHPTHEMEALILLLEAAFECFPDRDYCVLTIPSTCPSFPLIRQFLKVAPRAISTYPQELYVLHRNAIMSNLCVRLATKNDIEEVQELVKYMVVTSMLMVDFAFAANGDDVYCAYVLLSENHIVGFAILKDEDDYEYLKSHYDFTNLFAEEYYKFDSHGLMKHFIISPAFLPHSRYFLREIHRLSDFNALYCTIYPSDNHCIERDQILCCAVGNLIAIRPRMMPEFTQTDLDGCCVSEDIRRVEEPFALYLSTPRYCGVPRHEINTKIVIVGSGNAATAFLDSLVSNFSRSYMTAFQNLNIVAPHGLNRQIPDNAVRNMMFPSRNKFNYRYICSTSMWTYINVINSVMTGIDRKNKLLIVNDTNYVSYDLLFLICGKQFQKPTLSNTERIKSSKFPENIFLVNTEIDATYALKKLKKLIIEYQCPTYTVIVYGYAIEAYCCIAALLSYGVPGINIVFVEPFLQDSNKFENHCQIFNDPVVTDAVFSALIEESVTTYLSYNFVNWSVSVELNRVTLVKFESQQRRIDIECIAMFMYNKKMVSAKTFMAISKAGLVFDGGLVINPDCRTNDPNIYAVGTITKYSRRYYADHLAHKYFNREEIGWKLGQDIKRKLIPSFDELVDVPILTCKRENVLVPIYEQPLVTYCCLPGELHYLYVTKPGVQIPLEVAKNSDDYGQLLVTGNSKSLKKQGYFRLHLNQYGVVETITCLTKSKIDRVNLTSLWGKHEKLLNNLQARFKMLFITDLYDYFREPWTCAIYHDQFNNLDKNIKDLMMSLTMVTGDSPLEDLLRMYEENDWKKLTTDQKEKIEKKFLNSPFHKMIEQKVLNFLHSNRSFLPVYAHPTIVKQLYSRCSESPLFKPQ